MKNALSKFKNNLDTVRQEESGDIVQTILIIAVFVVIVVVVGKLLYSAINQRASSTTKCINSVNVASGGTTTGC